MRKFMRQIGIALFLFALLSGLAGCVVTPGVSIGIGADYYGGKFHVSPQVNVGLTGRP